MAPLGQDMNQPMGFVQRLGSTLSALAIPVAVRFFYFRQLDAILEKEFGKGGKYEGLLGEHVVYSEELLYRPSVLLMNGHFSISGVRPLLPSSIEIGGMHCTAAKPLPKDLEDFVSASKQGFVLFSLGSAVKGSDLAEDRRQVLTEAFAKFPDYKFLWKWETETMPNLPSNVKLSKWLPQQDLLGHKKIRAFITHGGLLSTQEAVYHGVPVIGIPLAGDQHMNMARTVAEGAGLSLNLATMTIDDVVTALKTILGEPRFKEHLEQRAKIFKDQPQTPRERGVYWTEYVIRHHGAHHLKSAAVELYWYQYFLLDVWLFIAFILLTVGIIEYYVIRWFLRLIMSLLTKSSAGKSAAKKQQKKKGKKD
jgi:glucuronosyltransferase